MDASQVLGVQVAAVNVPAMLQDERPDTVYPVKHLGLHVLPLAREPVQSPASPFSGAMAALQVVTVSTMHVAAVNTPAELHIVDSER